MSNATPHWPSLLERSLESGRIHSAYLLSGPGGAPRECALRFARALACDASGERPCESCSGCRRTAARETIALDGTGKRGPLLRHVGDHPDLFWVERGAEDTRVRIGQIRALQRALRLRSSEGGHRVAVIADAEWLNQESQNALLRLLEEPPAATTLVLVAATSAGLLVTVRSRCQRVVFRDPEADLLADPEHGETVSRLDEIEGIGAPDLLDWAAEYRGARAPAAQGVQGLLDVAAAWLERRVANRATTHGRDLHPELEAHHVLADCRKSLVQRNANPQMVAERALFALHGAVAR